MSLALAIAIYFICWWLVLFTMLPIGVRTQQEEGEIEPGTPESAPVAPRILPKLVATTVISSVVFAGIYMIIEHKLITLDDIPFLPRFDDLSGQQR